MIVEGSASVAAPCERLWAVLSDPAALAGALPRVEAVSVEDSSRFSALARPRTALGETPVAMDFEVADQRPPEHVRISGSGRAGESLVTFQLDLDLSGDGERTNAGWRAEVALTGVLGSLLQRGLGPLFNQQVEEVLAAGARISEGNGTG